MEGVAGSNQIRLLLIIPTPQWHLKPCAALPATCRLEQHLIASAVLHFCLIEIDRRGSLSFIRYIDHSAALRRGGQRQLAKFSYLVQKQCHFRCHANDVAEKWFMARYARPVITVRIWSTLLYLLHSPHYSFFNIDSLASFRAISTAHCGHVKWHFTRLSRCGPSLTSSPPYYMLWSCCLEI